MTKINCVSTWSTDCPSIGVSLAVITVLQSCRTGNGTCRQVLIHSGVAYRELRDSFETFERCAFTAALLRTRCL